MTRFKLRGGRLLLVRGPYENEEVLRAMNLQQAIQWACQLLETIDRVAVLQGVTITPRDGAVAVEHDHVWQGSLVQDEWTCVVCGDKTSRSGLALAMEGIGRFPKCKICERPALHAREFCYECAAHWPGPV